MVRLDRNEKVDAWPEQVWKCIQKAITPEVIMSYPEFETVYSKLASLLRVDRANLLLSHGSDIALKSIFDVYIGPGEEAVVLSPSYAMYPIYAQMNEAKAVEVGFDDNLSLPFERILSALTSRTRIVCIPNPNQPIERVFTEQELEVLFERAMKDDFILVIDEAYHYFHRATALGAIRRIPNLIVTRSFSKAFGLAGLRAGLVISNAERITEIKKVKPISEINSVAVKLIELFIDHMEWVEDHVARVGKGRAMVLERAAKLGIHTHGLAGNSVLLELKSGDQVRQVVEKARAQGILFKGPFSAPATHHLRITLGSEALMNQAMKIIEKELS
jgi:histidinol-phosphate aminotransferase